MLRAITVCATLMLAGTVPAAAQQPGITISPPFTATLSNTTPLVFGMTVEQAAQALRTPLHYLRGRRGDEMFLTYRHAGGSGFFPRGDRLFLQFRNFRLTGWKGDWGSSWMWP
ncbi:hypothetical protein [Rhodopseudomonas sp. B29]|uniref:hypothetical protein n=1 Tax=Rhodopseudomonas sp. B29 TaxID=95607 RepID=UPI0004CF0C16|nr:hypothetical protein [Rhodopseudomonas sp. B29]